MWGRASGKNNGARTTILIGTCCRANATTGHDWKIEGRIDRELAAELNNDCPRRPGLVVEGGQAAQTRRVDSGRPRSVLESLDPPTVVAELAGVTIHGLDQGPECLSEGVDRGQMLADRDCVAIDLRLQAALASQRLELTAHRGPGTRSDHSPADDQCPSLGRVRCGERPISLAGEPVLAVELLLDLDDLAVGLSDGVLVDADRLVVGRDRLAVRTDVRGVLGDAGVVDPREVGVGRHRLVELVESGHGLSVLIFHLAVEQPRQQQEKENNHERPPHHAVVGVPQSRG